MAFLRKTTITMVMVALAVSSCSSSDTPTPGRSPSSSPSADPLRGASLLLQVMRGQTRAMLLACTEYTAPDDPACGQAVKKMATAAQGVRDYLGKIPPNAKVTQLDKAMAQVEKSVGGLRTFSCYGLSKPPSPDLDKATKRQLCFVEYGILLASVTAATDEMTYG
jgi:hypothetical protein